MDVNEEHVVLVNDILDPEVNSSEEWNEWNKRAEQQAVKEHD